MHESYIKACRHPNEAPVLSEIFGEYREGGAKDVVHLIICLICIDVIGSLRAEVLWYVCGWEDMASCVQCTLCQLRMQVLESVAASSV